MDLNVVLTCSQRNIDLEQRCPVYKDAIDAVKQDPAVLHAQIQVNGNKTSPILEEESSEDQETTQGVEVALEAVKQDPAVLDALIQVDENNTSSSTSENESCKSQENSENVEIALEAVKQDPAVLDALIQVDEMNLPSSHVPENDDSKDQETTEGAKTESSSSFEDTVRQQKAAVLALAPPQLDMLLQFAEVLRLQRNISQSQAQSECAFCKKNGERSVWYSSHILRDRSGRVRCPVLRDYRCPTCGATGDHAHTIKYCPKNRY